MEGHVVWACSFGELNYIPLAKITHEARDHRVPRWVIGSSREDLPNLLW